MGAFFILPKTDDPERHTTVFLSAFVRHGMPDLDARSLPRSSDDSTGTIVGTVMSPATGDLKYGSEPEPSGDAAADELLTVKLRYKQPDGDTSRLLMRPLPTNAIDREKSREYHFAPGTE